MAVFYDDEELISGYRDTIYNPDFVYNYFEVYKHIKPTIFLENVNDASAKKLFSKYSCISDLFFVTYSESEFINYLNSKDYFFEMSNLKNVKSVVLFVVKKKDLPNYP